jgi:hypothetical protein
MKRLIIRDYREAEQVVKEIRCKDGIDLRAIRLKVSDFKRLAKAITRPKQKQKRKK